MDATPIDSNPADSPISPHRTTWLILSYIWVVVCCIVLPALPLVIEREDEFAKWHARHGMVLGLLWLVVSVALLVPANLFGVFGLGVLRTIVYVLWLLAWLGVVGVCAVSMLRAFDGQRWALKPVEAVLSRLSF